MLVGKGFDELMAGIVQRVSNSRISVHSVLLSHVGEMVGQWHRSARDRHTPHRMYSISKSVTAVGVGFLLDDGAFALDTTLAQCFPEFEPMHPWVGAATVSDLLQMRSPHSQTTYKRYGGSWLESFFRIDPTHQSGTVFRYDTGASYVLAALVERTTGQTMVDFLQQRVWRELGASDQISYVPSPEGISSGGSGLMCLPSDLVLLANWLNQGGLLNGRQVLSREFITAATTKQVPTTMQTWGTQFHYGYGYQTWVPFPGAYLFFGMGGQIVFSIPEKEIVLVVTADTQRIPTGEQFLLDLLWAELLEPLFPGAIEPAPFIAGGKHVSDPQGEWEGQYRSATPGLTEELTIQITSTGGHLLFGNRAWSIPISYCEPVSIPDFGGFGFATITGGWLDENFLKLVCEIQDEEISSVEIELYVSDTSSAPETITVNTQGYGELLPARWSGVQTFERIN